MSWSGGKFEAFVKGVEAGKGTTSYRCGLCPTVLVKNINYGEMRRIVFKCPKCGSYNELP